MSTVKGYKVFKPDWTCRNKQYTCPGKFEEDKLEICKHGMHFCRNILDCFNYYSFTPDNKVAEVIAYGDVIDESEKSCTDKLEIVREISWEEVLRLVNIGEGNTGNRNTGNRNAGNRNTGFGNTGNRNTGDYNAGNSNTGNRNTGDYNAGNSNTGHWNTGSWNTGNRNTGFGNTGNRNTGYRNTGRRNTGDWNKSDYNTGCFNTDKAKISFFNKPSDWTYQDWRNSKACSLLIEMPHISWIDERCMTEDEKQKRPSYKTTGGYLKIHSIKDRQKYWNDLSEEEKIIIKSLPNFDADIFKEITGINVEE